MKREAGFTLTEIAIVLVIVGLLLGGVMKGRAMIENAKVKNLENGVNGYIAAINAFRERYKALPGDFKKASVRIDGGVSNGNGNGRVDWQERYLFWAHLAKAGFISGDYDGQSTSPQHAYSASVSSFWKRVQGKYAHWLEYQSLPVKAAAQLDLDLDDGKPKTGSIRTDTRACIAGSDYKELDDNVCHVYVEF